VQILGAVRRAGARGAYAIDVAARALGQVFPVAPSPKVPARKSGAEGTGAARVIAFVGPTGVGKTTTLAKLAIRLAQAGRRVVAATMDTYRVGAVDQLRTYADLLEIPAVVAATGDDLAEAVRERSDADVVLVDTTGRSPRDAGNLAKLAAALERADNGVELDRYLVLSAASRPRDLDEAGRGFAATRPSALVITKLDETNEPASALEYSIYAGLGLAFLCDGQDVRAHLHRPHPDRLADLVLRGRIA
jgi:flagellar biosynthesis protein FlhF